ncbi:MAG: hypothetical protein IKY91_03290 [Akkermansia sp.]|nr:hypothetical protein [Akkermansia sp.]
MTEKDNNSSACTGTIRHIILYHDGGVARGRKEESCSNVLYNISVPQSYYNKTKARLLFCYNNGRVAVLNPWKLLSQGGKLHNTGKVSNGYNKEEGVLLTDVFLCNKTDYLVTVGRKKNGDKTIKAQCLEGRSDHGAKSMDLLGNIFLKQEEASVISYHVVSGEDVDEISDIIFKPKSSAPGHVMHEKGLLAFPELVEALQRNSRILHFTPLG